MAILGGAMTALESENSAENAEQQVVSWEVPNDEYDVVSDSREKTETSEAQSDEEQIGRASCRERV